MLSIVIPAYNEKENILKIIGELKENISNCKTVESYEIIVIDDHSDDNTFDIVKQLLDNNIKVIRLSRRSGSHTALRVGLKYARGKMVLCISADSQDDPSVLRQMIAKMDEGSQIIWAVRNDRKEPFFQKLFASLFYKLLLAVSRQMKSEINLANADFYLLSRKVVDAINACKEKNTSLFGLVIWLGFKQDFVAYERRERYSGKSKFSFRSRFRLAKDWIIAFSGLPLKVISVIGLIIAFLGILYAIVILILALTNRTIPGWAEITILILIIGGLQTTMLGIMGEYLWRNIDESRNRPLYFIEETNILEEEL